MEGKTTRVPRDHTGDWLVVLRVFVLFPALVTVLAMGASALLSRGANQPGADARPEPGTASLELAPAQGARLLPEPRFGPALNGVFSVGDAAQTPEGWVVLDRRAQQIVYLDSDGRLLRQAGRAGQGPGELQRAADLAVLDSLVVVVNAPGRALDLFGLDGQYRTRVPLDAPGCAGALVRELLAESGTLAMLSLCTRPDGSSSALVERIRLTGERLVLLDRVYNDFGSGKVDPSRVPMLTRVNGKLHFVIAPDRCVSVLEADGDAVRWVCHPDDNPLLIPDSLKATFRELEPKAKALGATLIIPERFPPFDGILEVGGHLAFHVVIDDHTHALEIVRGNQLERVILPARASFSVGTDRLLLVQDRQEGTAFATLSLP